MGHVLVIDDDSGVRETFALTLEACGHDVTTASGGLEGLAAARNRKPDLIFLDLKMPGMTGVDTLRHLQSICPDSPVYIVTGFYEEFLVSLRQLQNDGINFDVARKPLGLAEIRAIADSRLKYKTAPIPLVVAEASA
ncbi:MAG: response regulator [Rhodospirillaceae bacterium]|nr:response regulator [Rhodospirillaceae bacterium]